jgi:hypothetical protein
LEINNGPNDTATAIEQCEMLGDTEENMIPVKYLPIGGKKPISYGISLSGMRADDESTMDMDESLDITISSDDGMEMMGDAKYRVDGMHSYTVMEIEDGDGSLTVTGIADTKSAVALDPVLKAGIPLKVTLMAEDSHSTDRQMVSRDLMRNVTITPRMVLSAMQGGSDARNEGGDESDDAELGTYEKSFSADDFPNRPGTPDQLPLLGIMAADGTRQNVGGTIQGEKDQDWFLIREVAPDYLIQLQIVGNADFELIPVASVSDEFMDGHTLMGRPADLPDYDRGYDSLRCGDYYVKVTGTDEAVYTLGWRIDLDGDAATPSS